MKTGGKSFVSTFKPIIKRSNIFTMKRCLFVFLPAFFTVIIAHSQLVNNGATITVQNGATIKCSGNIVNKGTIQNAGIVSSDGELRNEAGGTLANSAVGCVYEATTKFVNYGNSFKNINLRLIGNANTDSIKGGVGSTYLNVNLAKGAGTTASLSDPMLIKGGFSFDNDNNQLVLGDQTIIMDSVATFQNPDNNQFVITNGTGAVIRTNLATTAFVYPVGSSTTEFNPLTISNSGTPDDISVRCLQNVQANGTSGSVITTDFVNNSWVVNEGTPNGSNLTLTGQWVASDEPASFNRLKSGIARFNIATTDWDLPASNVLAAAGSGTYVRSRTGITSTGVFAVADLDQVNAARLSLKVFLQGPYNTTTLMMNDGLRSNNVIPVVQPYSASIGSNFMRVGVYDGSSTANEHVPSTSVFDVAGTNNDIVDWVYVALLDAANPSTKLQSRAALLQRDGDIVEYDSASGTYLPLRMPIDSDGDYYIMVGHRNHLPVRTPVAQTLHDNIIPLTYDFTTSQNQAYQNPAVLALTPPNNNSAMKNLGNGSYAMWLGNVNFAPGNPISNTTVRLTGGEIFNDYLQMLNVVLGGNFTIIVGPPVNPPAVYNNADVNMDGTVRATGGEIFNDYLQILNRVLGGNFTVIFTQHL
jgi:hypothetical protein